MERTKNKKKKTNEKCYLNYNNCVFLFPEPVSSSEILYLSLSVPKPIWIDPLWHFANALEYSQNWKIQYIAQIHSAIKIDTVILMLTMKGILDILFGYRRELRHNYKLYIDWFAGFILIYASEKYNLNLLWSIK